MNPDYAMAVGSRNVSGFDRPVRKGQAIAALQNRADSREYAVWVDRGESSFGVAPTLRGHGPDHHGVLASGVLQAAGADPCPAPIQDDWDF